MLKFQNLSIVQVFLLALLVAVGVGIIGGQSSSLQAQSEFGCGGPCLTYGAMQNYGWTPPPSYTPVPSIPYNQSLRASSYRDTVSEPGAEYCCDFEPQARQAERIEQRNWRLQNLYQNSKSIACGPAFDPRARDGC